MSKLNTLAAAAALLAGCVSAAMAQEASYPPADTNRDGVVTDRERAEFDARYGAPVVVVTPPYTVVVPQTVPDARPPFGTGMQGDPAHSPNPNPGRVGGR